MDPTTLEGTEGTDEDAEDGYREATGRTNLHQRVARWRDRESFRWRWFGNAVKFGVEFSMFFAVLSLLAVPATIALPGATLAPDLQTATPWHVVVPSSLTLTGAAWCWSV